MALSPALSASFGETPAPEKYSPFPSAPSSFKKELGEEKNAPLPEGQTKEEFNRLRLQNEALGKELKKFQEEINALQQFAIQTTEGKLRLKEMLAKYEEGQKQKEKAIEDLSLLRKKLEEKEKQAITPTAATPQASPRVKFVSADTARSQGIPILTQTPNVITGIVADRQGVILPGAIVTINDQRSNPVRAMKTNNVGQFKTGTPLSNGSYTIELEKEGYDFDIIAIEVKGQVLSPLEIKAK